MSTAEESNGAVLGFIGHNASKGNARSVIDSDMDVLPAGAFAEIASVARDAVTWALDTGEFFDVEVNELPWVSTLVAPRRGWRIEQGKAMKLVAAQDARDTRFGAGALLCDLEAWHSHSAQRKDDGDLGWWDLAWAVPWTRGAIAQSGSSLAAKTRYPLAGGAFAHCKGRRGGLSSEPSVDDDIDKSFSTPRG